MSDEFEKQRELQCVWWELALAWRQYDAAVREWRLEDAQLHARQRELAEGRARILLNMEPRQP